MGKLIRQNVGGIDYTTVGCMLTGSCATAAADFVKDIVLSDGNSIFDGMTVACTFDYANTAGNSPSGQTVYSSDQITYYEDDQLTIPVTLAPSGCYTIEYTGTGNAYTYVCYPVLQIGNVKAPLKDSQGNILSGNIWQDGEKIMLTYTAGYFMRTGSGGDADIDFYETEADVDAALAGMPDGQYATWPSVGASQSVPINEVKSGDMHAVTSNAVADCLSYSYTEHKTGKKFIDGKDIYSRTYALSHPANSGDTSFLISSDLDYVTKVEFFTTKLNSPNNWQFFEQGVWGTNFDWTIAYYRTENNYLAVKYGASFAQYEFIAYFTVEYTKTID